MLNYGIQRGSDIMSTLASRISSRRKELDMTQEELAKKLGYKTKSTICRIESGDNDIPLNRVDAFADALQVSRAYIMGWEGEDSNIVPLHSDIKDIKDIKRYRTELLGDVACGVPITANAEYETYIETDFDPKADHCVRAKGDSMIGARIYDGDIVFIKDCNMVDNGDIAVVIIDGEVTLKRFYYYREENVVKLIAENPNYAPLVYSGEELDHIKIIGKALFFQGIIK